MTTVIITNGARRDLLCWHDLTAKEQAEFDYLATEDAQDQAQFVRYLGWVYDLGQFMPAGPDLKPWAGVSADSCFSAVLVRYVAHGERAIMGRAYS